MRLPDRLKGEYRRVQHDGAPVTPPGRPKGSSTALRSIEVAP